MPRVQVHDQVGLRVVVHVPGGRLDLTLRIDLSQAPEGEGEDPAWES